MKEILYIRLREAETAAALPYALWSPDAGLQERSATLDQLAAIAVGKRLVLLAPAEDVRLASISVPARSPQKVLQAAPYVLEEQLAEDVDSLHFALGQRQADGSHPVAIVSRARMQQWLDPFTSRGIQPQALVPEQLALPWSADERLHLLAESGRCIVRSGAFQGFACPTADIGTYLQIADPEQRYALRAFVLPESPDLTALGRSLELLPGHRSALEVLAKQWRAETSINLLQGAYSQRENLNRAWAPWRIPAALAAACLLLALSANGLQAWKLNGLAAAQEARNVQRFQALFPAEKKIVDLSVQAEQQLALLKASGAQGGLLKLLEPLASALVAVPGMKVQNLQFREGAIYLNLTAADLQALENLRAWFGEHPGMALEVQSANSGAEGAQIRVKVSPV